MPRPQFTLRALLVAMLVLGAFFAAMAAQKQFDKPIRHVTTTKYAGPREAIVTESMTTRDGVTWERSWTERPCDCGGSLRPRPDSQATRRSAADE